MSDDYLKRIGGLIRTAREHKGKTQGQLAEARNLYVALRYGPRSWGAQLNRSELSRLKFLVNQLKV